MEDGLLDPVEDLFEKLDRQVQALTLIGDASLALRVSEVASKSLLLAAASRFEGELTSIVADAASQLSQSEVIAEFCVNQGLVRRYHTLFDWEANNANKFFRLFGEGFAVEAKLRVTEDAGCSAGVSAFLRIGRERNLLIHSDFVSYPLTSTLSELIEEYQRARRSWRCVGSCSSGTPCNSTVVAT